jgi:hypothetical protein
MRRIGIGGAGQAGLHVGIGLLQHGYSMPSKPAHPASGPDYPT